MMVVYNLIDIGLYFFSAGIICVIALSQLYRSSRSYVTVKLGFLMIAVVIYGSLAISDSDVAEANIDLNQGRVADARKSFDRSLGFNPFNFSAYLGRAISDPAGLQTDSARNDIQRSLKLFPQYASGLFYHSLIDFRNGYLLSALYHAGAAFHKHRLSKQYRNWYEFVKKKLPSRNLIQRN